MKVCLDLCPRATILMVLCAHLGRPYLPEPALSALRMLREQGHSRDIWESELSLCLVPSKCPQNSKICDQNWNYAMLYEVKTRWAHASFSYMWYIPSRNGGWILTTVRPFASDTSLWVRCFPFSPVVSTLSLHQGLCFLLFLPHYQSWIGISLCIPGWGAVRNAFSSQKQE